MLEKRQHHFVHFCDACQVVDAVIGHRRLNGGVGVLEAGLQPLVVSGERDQGSQVPAGGATRDRDEVRVAAVVGNVLADPGQGAFDVDDVCRPHLAGALAVIDGHADPAQFGHPAHQRIRLRPFTVDNPRSARDLEQHRRPATRLHGGMTPDVKQVVTAVWAIGDIRRLRRVTAAMPGCLQQTRAAGARGVIANRMTGLFAILRPKGVGQRGGEDVVGPLSRPARRNTADRQRRHPGQGMPGDHVRGKFGR